MFCKIHHNPVADLDKNLNGFLYGLGPIFFWQTPGFHPELGDDELMYKIHVTSSLCSRSLDLQLHVAIMKTGHMHGQQFK